MLSQIIKIKKKPKISQRELKTLLLDAIGTGQRREYHSGKKKRQTITTATIIESSKIIQISDPLPGRVHDITMRRKSDPIPAL